MKILSIGNSFSTDAQRWLHQTAAAMGVDILAVNLYIGGCSLQTHWEKWQSGEEAYALEINGEHVRAISLAEGLSLEDWDVVTMQQASHFSGKPATYRPFMHDLAAVVRERCPGAKLWVHQTWAYEIDSQHGSFPQYRRDQRLMYNCLTDAYASMADELGASIIPVGEAVQFVRDNIPEFDYAGGRGLSLNRDGFHLSLLYGRYLAALVWIHALTGEDIRKTTFVPVENGESADPALLAVLREAVWAFFAQKRDLK